MSFIVLPERLKSTQGESKTNAAGKGNPASRITIAVLRLSPPPAESPAITSFSGLVLGQVKLYRLQLHLQ